MTEYITYVAFDGTEFDDEDDCVAYERRMKATDYEGEIFFQLINISPYPIQLQKGDRIGQGIIKPYFITEDDAAAGDRTGGFGSTN